MASIIFLTGSTSDPIDLSADSPSCYESSENASPSACDGRVFDRHDTHRIVRRTFARGPLRKRKRDPHPSPKELVNRQIVNDILLKLNFIPIRRMNSQMEG